jgi:hypothetical protein
MTAGRLFYKHHNNSKADHQITISTTNYSYTNENFGHNTARQLGYSPACTALQTEAASIEFNTHHRHSPPLHRGQAVSKFIILSFL